MSSPFLNLFPGLTEERAIEMLETPLEQLKEKYHRYLAAAHLANFPTERSIDALMNVLKDDNPAPDNRRAQRKAIESLGRVKATRALEAIRPFLADEDCYVVENTVWAIGEIGTDDETLLEEVAQLLETDGQLYRAIIQTLAKQQYKPALERIARFTNSDDPAIASAAIATIAKLSGDRRQTERVVDFLYKRNIHARRGAIQDLMELKHYPAIGVIAVAPVSQSLRLRGMEFLATDGYERGEVEFATVESSFDRAIWDRPDSLKLVHEYSVLPSLEWAIDGLFNTDFGYCYLASKTIVASYLDAGETLEQLFHERARDDYGAHYNVIKLFGWLEYAPAYELLLETLFTPGDIYFKSRIAAAVSLGCVGDRRAIPHLFAALEDKSWKLKYACLLALDCFEDSTGRERCVDDKHWLVREKARSSGKFELTSQ